MSVLRHRRQATRLRDFGPGDQSIARGVAVLAVRDEVPWRHLSRTTPTPPGVDAMSTYDREHRTDYGLSVHGMARRHRDISSAATLLGIHANTPAMPLAPSERALRRRPHQPR